MEKLLIALDDTPGSLKSIHYLIRLHLDTADLRLCLYHVLPSESPNLLRGEEVRRIEALQLEHPDLSGYFWNRTEEDKMNRAFETATRLLTENGFKHQQIETHFTVRSSNVAELIISKAARLKCGTIVLGRRGLGAVKGFFLGSVSTDVAKMAKEMTVWIVD